MSGTVSTFAGAGPFQSGFVNATGTSAKFNNPRGISADSSGNLYVADTSNNCIRKINTGAVVTTFAGQATSGSTNSTGTAASFFAPTDTVVDSSGNVFVADNGNNMIRKITSAGVVTTLAGQTTSGFLDSTGTAAKFNAPQGVTVDGSGNVYVADTNNNRIRKITSGGVVTTLAGTATAGSTDGTGTGATFNSPYGIYWDPTASVLYVGQSGSIRRVTTAGVVTTVVSGLGWIKGITVDNNGNMYASDATNNKILLISGGAASTAAGTGGSNWIDGDATTTAQFSAQSHICWSNGWMYIADTSNAAIRQFSPVTVVTSTDTGSGTEATSAESSAMSVPPSKVAFTLLAANNAGNGGTSYVMGPVSPAANSGLLAFVSTAHNPTATGDSLTCTGFGLNWTLIGQAVNPNGNCKIAVFYAQCGSSPGSGSVTVSFPNANQRDMPYALVQVTGHDPSLFVKQNAIGAEQSPGFAPFNFGATLGTMGSPYSRSIGFYVLFAGGTTTATQPTGWTSLFAGVGASNSSYGQLADSPNADTNGIATSSTSTVAMWAVLEVAGSIAALPNDSGAFTDGGENVVISRNLSDTDTGSATDAQLLYEAVGVKNDTDTGTFTESNGTVVQLTFDDDTAFFDEAAFLHQMGLSDPDTGTFTETEAVTASLVAPTDTATGTESLVDPFLLSDATDPGGDDVVVLDDQTVVHDVEGKTDTDNVSAVDAEALDNIATDAGVFTEGDNSQQQLTPKVSADSGTFTESANLDRFEYHAKTDAETFTFTDAEAELSGPGEDISEVADTGTFTESEVAEDVTFQDRFGDDPVAATDAEALLGQPADDDPVTATDGGEAVVRQVSDNDSVHISDSPAEAILNLLSSADTARFRDTGDLFEVIHGIITGDTGRFRDLIDYAIFIPPPDGSSPNDRSYNLQDLFSADEVETALSSDGTDNDDVTLAEDFSLEAGWGDDDDAGLTDAEAVEGFLADSDTVSCSDSEHLEILDADSLACDDGGEQVKIYYPKPPVGRLTVNNPGGRIEVSGGAGKVQMNNPSAKIREGRNE